MPLSDADFIDQFERKILSPEHFNHIGHLRLAWLYLQKNSLTNAVKRMLITWELQTNFTILLLKPWYISSITGSLGKPTLLSLIFYPQIRI